MHFCSAYIALGGDIRNVVHRGAFDPVSYPEIEVLRAIHGDDAVRDVEVVGEHASSPKEEKERLLGIYGRIVEDVHKGRIPSMEMEMPGAKVKPQPWRNPVARDPAEFGFIDPTAKKEPAPEAEAPKAKTTTPKVNPFAE